MLTVTDLIPSPMKASSILMDQRNIYDQCYLKELLNLAKKKTQNQKETQ